MKIQNDNVRVVGIFDNEGKCVGTSFSVENPDLIDNAVKCAVVLFDYQAEDAIFVNRKEVIFYDQERSAA